MLGSIQGAGGGAAGPDTQIVYLRNAGPREIATSLQQLGGTGASVSVSAMDSANAVLLRGDPAAVARFARLIRDLDAGDEGTESESIGLEHADAEQLLPVLQQLSDNRRPARSRPGFRQDQEGEGTGAGPATRSPAPAAPASAAAPNRPAGASVVAAISGNNAVIIAANLDAQRQLGEVIRHPTHAAAVLVEAIISRSATTRRRRLGLQFLLRARMRHSRRPTVRSASRASSRSARSPPTKRSAGGPRHPGRGHHHSRDNIVGQSVIDAPRPRRSSPRPVGSVAARRDHQESVVRRDHQRGPVGHRVQPVVDSVDHDPRQSGSEAACRAGSAGYDRRGLVRQFRQRVPHRPAPECRHPARRQAAGQFVGLDQAVHPPGSVERGRAGVGARFGPDHQQARVQDRADGR